VNIHVEEAVVDEQLLEFKGNLNGDMVRNLERGKQTMTGVVRFLSVFDIKK
jgi:hypothetical protein